MWRSTRTSTLNARVLPLPLVIATVIAACLTQMGFRTNVLLLPMHHPLHVAEDMAVVDVISGRRFVLGVGLGRLRHGFEVLFDRKNHSALLNEEGRAA